jgi:hypothetical protein
MRLAELVDLIDDRVPISHVVLPTHELDAVRRTDRGAQSTGHALRTTVRMCLHHVRAPPSRRERRFLLGILEGDMMWIDHVL